MNHLELLRMAQTLGYQIDEAGFCLGFTSAWAKACYTGDLGRFYLRIRFLEKYKDDAIALKRDISTAANPTYNVFGGQVERTTLSEISTFFATITFRQQPDNYKNFFQESDRSTVSQVSMTALANITGDQVTTLHSDYNIHDETKLTDYLRKLSTLIKEEDRIPIIFGSERHVLGVRILGLDRFEFMDSNGTAESADIKPVQYNASQLAKALFKALATPKEKELALTASFFASLNPVEENKHRNLSITLQDLSENMYQRSSPEQIDRSLHTAVREDDFKAVHYLLTHESANANVAIDDKMPPLLLAATRGNERILNELIKYDTTLNTKDNTAMALRQGAYFGHVSIIDSLISKGADVDTTNEDGDTPLILAAQGGYLDVVTRLIDAGCEIVGGAENPLINGAGR